MALLDLLQLPNGSFGMPTAQPLVDPYTGRDPFDVAAERTRRSIRRPAPSAVDYSQWDSGPTPVPFPDMLQGPSEAAAALTPPPAPMAAPPVASPAAMAPATPASASAGPAPMWPGMLNAPLPADIAGGGGYPRPAPPTPPAASAPAQASVALPATSTPATGPIDTPAPVPPTSMLGRIGDMLNNRSSTLLALGAGLMGSQNLGQGLSRGFAAAIPAQQQDIRQQQINQSLPIIRDRLMKTQNLSATEANNLAQAAITNPAIMQQLVPGLFGAKQRQFTQIGEDMMGNKRFGFVDPVAGKAYDLSGRELTRESTGGATVPTGSNGQPLQGQDLLQHLEKNDPVTAAGVKGLIEGNISSSGRNLQKLAPLASLVDPTFDASQYPVRLATRKNYTSGRQFQEVQAINTVAGHLDNLSKSADDLNNTRFPWWNTVANTALQATGDPRVDKFNTDKQAVTNELSKAYRGGHVTEGDVREWQSNISAAKSPEQLKAVIGEMNELLNSKRAALEDGYRSSMGKAPLPQEFSSVSKRAGEVFNRVADWSHGVKAEKTAAPATPSAAASALPTFTPKPNATYRYDPASGRFIETK
jgi:hypothetical protein